MNAKDICIYIYIIYINIIYIYYIYIYAYRICRVPALVYVALCVAVGVGA